MICLILHFDDNYFDDNFVFKEPAGQCTAQGVNKQFVFVSLWFAGAFGLGCCCHYRRSRDAEFDHNDSKDFKSMITLADDGVEMQNSVPGSIAIERADSESSLPMVSI